MSYSSYMKDVLQRLKRIIHENHLTLVYTKPAYFFRETVNKMESVNYFIELVDKGNEMNLEYNLDIPKLNQRISLKYAFDVYGCIEWKK